MRGLVQKVLERSLSIAGLDVYLLMVGKRWDIISRLLVRSYFLRYSPIHRTRPLSGRCSGLGQTSFW